MKVYNLTMNVTILLDLTSQTYYKSSQLYYACLQLHNDSLLYYESL